MTNICVIGARGRMGINICSVINDNPATEISGLAERPGHEDIGKEINGIEVKGSLKEALSGADAAIDFSSVEATLQNAQICSEAGIPLVIGTTGFSPKEKDILKKYSRKSALLLSPNMSVGVNLIFKIAKEISERLPGYEKEIIESHHSRKVDAPSGTAMKIAQMIAGKEDEYIYGRRGEAGPREKNEIGIHAVRGGNIVGEHTVIWIGPYDRIELTHRAASRKLFAQGAVRASIWIARKEKGFYSMEDVLK
ncbi:MAG: 4-hydroxy-tetrahydrodipicolinate reductase [Elusimicrobiota bacterium]|nr:4-hydroxy-tetrahydrodipicolinate reductase [Elusimicrobiota bacterium]